MNYTTVFQALGWNDVTPSGVNQTDTASASFDVDLVVYESVKNISSIILYSHSIGTFESKEDSNIYLRIFHTTIQKIGELFPHHLLYYIQNYEGFDPSKQIDHIRDQSLIPPVSDALDIIPFTNQRRICKEPPLSVQRVMPDVHFSKNIQSAIEELGLG